MSTPKTAPSLPATVPAERNAAMMLDDKQVAIKIDREGFLTRVRHTIRLEYGPHLYSASRPGSERDDTKVTLYQPGYMRYVQALGGTLTCPPAMRDPVTGAAVANPQVEMYPDSGLARRVTATGVCVVRNPQTGEYVASIQTVVFDCEHVLRQKMLAISADRADAVQIVSKDDLDEMRQAGALKGWCVLPLAPPFSYIVANMKNPAVRDAWQDFMNLAQSARQRACSKAERLAADHNPVVRRAWLFGELRTSPSGVRFVEIPVVTWVEYRGKQAIEEFVASLATRGTADGVEQVIVGESVEDDTPEPDEDLDPDTARQQTAEPQAPTAPAPRALEEKINIPDPALPPAREAEPVPVVVEAAKVEEPVAPVVAPEPQVEADPAVVQMHERIARLESRLPPAEVLGVRGVVGLGPDIKGVRDLNLLRAYQRELTTAIQHL